MDDSLFPYDKIRDEQENFMKDVYSSVSGKKCLIAHAPTGLGKTAAALSPCVSYALKHDLTVFFLTSRHTQHLMAIETLRKIRKKGKPFSATDIVGKKHMCAQDGVEALHSRQFHDYCRALRESGQCAFYSNLKKKDSDLKLVLDELVMEARDSDFAVTLGKRHGICPYEAAAIASQKSSIIVCDYYYMFNPSIREGFLKKSGKKIESSIIIVDEAHNLPGRMREMLTSRLSSVSIDRAIKEADKFSEHKNFLIDLRDLLDRLSSGASEKIIKKDDLICEGYDFEKIIEELSSTGSEIREVQQQSFIGNVADFLEAWTNGDDEGFARILSRKGKTAVLSYQCLDPGIETGSVVKNSFCTILMSGTLTPTRMYKELLGFPEGSVEKEYRNPFPKENRLSIIITGVTTKFSSRDEAQYKRIGEICINSVREIPGNVAIFFPSYSLLNSVYSHIYGKIGKSAFFESPGISKQEKHKIISNFKMSYLLGGALFGVIGGSFYEGVDLPGELLNGVIIVGLPLSQPNLETKKLIDYYDGKYGRGWDYGYIFPAFTKALQTAGRCIRSETDRGVIMFIDERYAWPKYYSCFPKDFKPKISSLYKEHIREFFNSSQKKLGF